MKPGERQEEGEAGRQAGRGGDGRQISKQGVEARRRRKETREGVK